MTPLMRDILIGMIASGICEILIPNDSSASRWRNLKWWTLAILLLIFKNI